MMTFLKFLKYLFVEVFWYGILGPIVMWFRGRRQP